MLINEHVITAISWSTYNSPDVIVKVAIIAH